MSAPGSPSGSGKNWSPRSARHAGIDNKKDLKEQAEMRMLFENPSAVEFACQHMLDLVNADFGTEFTMDEFQVETECTCDD